MKIGIENYFASLKGFPRNFGDPLKLLILLSSILLIHKLSSEQIVACYFNQSSKKLYTLPLSLKIRELKLCLKSSALNEDKWWGLIAGLRLFWASQPTKCISSMIIYIRIGELIIKTHF